MAKNIDPRSLQEQLNQYPETLSELSKHLMGLLQAAGGFHKIFTNNPTYLPYLEQAKQQGLPPLAKDIISQQQALGSQAETFSTPSFKDSLKKRP